jgi:hypothetical protein
MFYFNSANLGGGIYFSIINNCYILNNIFENNSANNYGGAIFN